MKVTLSGSIAGEFIVDERYEDGSVLLRPDTSIEAIAKRLEVEGRLATPDEFDAEFGHLPADGEG